MATFGLFILAWLGTWGTWLIFTDPTSKLVKMTDGKTPQQVTKDMKDWVEQKGVGAAAAKGCGFFIYLVSSIFFTFIVEPIVILIAILNKIGYQPIAYTMLAILATEWLTTALVRRKAKKNKEKKSASSTTTVVATTEDGRPIDAELLTDIPAVEEPIKHSHPVWRTTRKIFFSLPILYFWYIFLVGIDVLV